MSEVVERVAEALMRKIHRNPDLTMFGQAEDVKENWRVLARAAILAMREPSAKMVEAGATAICLSLDVSPDSWRDHVDEAEVAFMAGIDEALK